METPISNLRCYPDFVTCCGCQADLAETKAEFDSAADWPDWLDAGCCSPECMQSGE